MANFESSSMIRLNVGGKEFCTTVGTLTGREPDSMLATMFSGRHSLCPDVEKGYVFIDRDGEQFRHILNWLRNGTVVGTLQASDYSELLIEAEYYQLLGLMNELGALLQIKREGNEDEDVCSESTRTDIIKYYIPRKKTEGPPSTTRFWFRGVNLCSLDLSGLDLSEIDFSYACLRNVRFSGADLTGAKFNYANAESAIFDSAILCRAEFRRTDISKASFLSSDLERAKLSFANLKHGNFYKAKLKNASLSCADLTDANFEKGNLSGAEIYSTNFTNTNLKEADLQGASLEGVDLREAHTEGVNLREANFGWGPGNCVSLMVSKNRQQLLIKKKEKNRQQ